MKQTVLEDLFDRLIAIDFYVANKLLVPNRPIIVKNRQACGKMVLPIPDSFLKYSSFLRD